MGKKLYIGNLSYTVDSTQLNDLFGQVGTVESANSGRSKGFAFVEMSANQEAEAAIQKFNGSDLGGRAMNVSEAKPQAPRTNDYGSRRSY
jgi:RNA recognition motif-containing protein